MTPMNIMKNTVKIVVIKLTLTEGITMKRIKNEFHTQIKR
jgi:hypothetical protein